MAVPIYFFPLLLSIRYTPINTRAIPVSCRPWNRLLRIIQALFPHQDIT